jgi:hypothetical protein
MTVTQVVRSALDVFQFKLGRGFSGEVFHGSISWRLKTHQSQGNFYDTPLRINLTAAAA